MSITDELREYASTRISPNKGVLLAIADRIDAEHEAKVAYWQGASHKDGYDEGFKDGYLDAADTIAEYVTKLRLAEEEDA